jgi:hypothetical protein
VPARLIRLAQDLQDGHLDLAYARQYLFPEEFE